MRIFALPMFLFVFVACADAAPPTIEMDVEDTLVDTPALAVSPTAPPTTAQDVEQTKFVRARLRHRDALKFLRDDRKEDALRAVDQAIALDPSYPDPLRIRAVLLQQDDPDAACTAMKQYIELDDTDRKLRVGLLKAMCPKR